MELGLLWLLLVVAIGAWARNRGRSVVVWALVAIVFTPIVAAICLLILPRREHGPVALLANSLNGLADKLDQKSRELLARQQLERQRGEEEASNAEIERMNKLILERARQISSSSQIEQPSMPASVPTAQPVFGRRESRS